MTDKDKAVQILAIAGRLSIARAEDLYDSLFEKPVVPKFVADWYEGNKEYLDYNIWEFIKHWAMQPEDEFKKWMLDDDKIPIITLVNMHQFGYEVEKEKRYRVKIKANKKSPDYLVNTGANGLRFYNNIFTQQREHTRKELENAGFGWVFDCLGMEVEEVE